MNKLLLSFAAVAAVSSIGYAQTAEKPYTVDEYLENYEVGKTEVYVTGYIVGSVDTSGSQNQWVFGIGTAPSNTNLLLAGSSAEDEKTMCIAVQLPSGSVRDALNLQLHPENLGHQVTLCGNMENYFSVSGMKSTKSYSWIGTAPATPDPTIIGSLETPITIEELLAKPMVGVNYAYVKGYIVGAIASKQGSVTVENDAVFGAEGVNATSLLLGPTADCTDKSLVIPLQLPAGDVRAALNLVDNPGNLGREVTVRGTYSSYCGAPGLKEVNEFKFGEGGGPAPVSKTVYSFPFSTLEGWTVDNVIDNGLDGWRTNSKPVCAIANSYKDGQNLEADSWLISPVIDLTGRTDCTASVDQGFGFIFSGQDKFVSANIREEGSAEWTKLTLTVWPEKGSGNWTSFATNDFDIKAFDGKKVQFGFHYTNDGKQSVAWELQNLVVKGEPSSAVSAIEAAEGEVLYFNLQGVRVANPECGLYIKVVNGKSQKVLVK